MSKFEIRLKELRIEKNLTQKMLAEVIGTSDDCIFSWEKGRAQPPAEMLIRLAEFFEVSTDYLLGLEDDFGNVAVQSGGAPALVEQDRELLDLFHELSPDYRETALNALRAMTGTPTRSTTKKRG